MSKNIIKSIYNSLQEKVVAEAKVNTNKDDLREQILVHAKNLEFEEAARIKNIIEKLNSIWYNINI